MAKVKLYIIEINVEDFKPEWAYSSALGSAPRIPGDKVEHLTVPSGKVWLFPIGGDVKKVRALIGNITNRFITERVDV